MKQIIVGLTMLAWALTAGALQPYQTGAKVAGGDLKAAVSRGRAETDRRRISVIGKHMPKGLPDHASIVVTDTGLSESLKAIGGSAVVAIPIRVGVKTDGTVSYVRISNTGSAPTCAVTTARPKRP